jgi:hypothetical protein
MASFVTKVADIYLDLVNERIIIAFFLHCHDIALSPSKKTYLEANLKDLGFPT